MGSQVVRIDNSVPQCCSHVATSAHKQHQILLHRHDKLTEGQSEFSHWFLPLSELNRWQRFWVKCFPAWAGPKGPGLHCPFLWKLRKTSWAWRSQPAGSSPASASAIAMSTSCLVIGLHLGEAPLELKLMPGGACTAGLHSLPKFVVSVLATYSNLYSGAWAHSRARNPTLWGAVWTWLCSGAPWAVLTFSQDGELIVKGAL